MKSILKKSLFSKLSWTGVLLGLYTSVSAQVNYVQNPSFEEFITCPNNVNQLDLAKHWKKPLSGGGTPDFMHSCATNSYIGIPINAYENSFSYQFPKSGYGYGRLYLFEYTNISPSYSGREYIQNILKSSLISGKEYCIIFYISLCNPSVSAINRIGVYFDDGSVSTISSNVINQEPDFEYIDNDFMKDTLSWIQISGKFIAKGNSSHLTIGNFRDNQNTNYITLPSYSGNGYLLATYYIDDVSVIESDLPAWAGNDTIINVGDSLFIGRPPEIGLDCTWYDIQGDSIGTGAGMWVSPVVPTTYIVEQVLCGGVKRDTVTVYAYPMGIPVTALNEAVRVYPNPASDVLTIEVLPGNSAGLILWNALGQVVLQSAVLESGKTQIPLRGIPDGIYFYEVIDDKKVGSYGKVVIQRE